jgi:hypothetical protein
VTIEYYRPDRIYGGLKREISTVEDGVSPHLAKQLIKYAYPDATGIKVVYGSKTRNSNSK